MNIVGSYLTDTNNYMDINEDAVNLTIESTEYGDIALGVVCDGFGGRSDGNYASSRLVDEMTLWLYTDFIQMMDSGFEMVGLHESWQSVLTRVNEDLIAYGLARNVKCGTTITALLLIGDQYFAIHVGDTKLLVVDKAVRKLTKDMVLDGDNKKLLSCVGINTHINCQFINGKIDEESMIIVCSDGFYNLMDDKKLVEIVEYTSRRDEKSLHKKLLELVGYIKNKGERDNISVLALGACI